MWDSMMDIKIDCENDDLGRLIYRRIGMCQEWFEYYKDTEKITKYTAKGKKNEFDYLDDGRLKLLKQPLRKIEKHYDEKGRMTYYKDSTGFECEWEYDKRKVITNVLSEEKEK